MYVRIVNKRKGGTAAQPGELIVAVDRTNPVLGNRFVLVDHTDSSARDEVIAKYDWERAMDEAVNGPMSREIGRLAAIVQGGQPIALQCWCAPRKCHAEPIRAQIARIVGHDVRPPDEVFRVALHEANTQGLLF